VFVFDCRRMVTDAELAEEEQRLGTWPRRLLYIPTLTSYEWEDGNVYGGHRCPKYAAITYTWGRWRIEDPIAARSAKALPIKFESKASSWEIPAIEPSHFDVDEFRNILEVARTRIPKELQRDKWKWKPPQFAWLDVACIDQTSHNPRSDAEIGRQAMIFKGAQIVYAWLAKTDHESLENGLKTLFEFGEITYDEARGSWGDAAVMTETEHLQRTREALSALENILKDKWFSSLWTLQEAHLRSDAVILSRKGETYIKDWADASLRDLFDCGRDIDLYLRRKLVTNSSLTKADAKRFNDSLSLIQRCGISALALMGKNDMAAYRSTVNREMTHEVDQFYAIQQIFGLRLGKTSLDAHFKTATSLSELQEQFSKEMLRCQPFCSALFVHSTEAEEGKGWMIGRDIVIPEVHMFDNIVPDWLDGIQVKAAASFTSECVHGVSIARFSGLTCSFSELEAACTRVYELKQVAKPKPVSVRRPVLHVCPDNCLEMRKINVRWKDFIPALTEVPIAAQQELQQKLRNAFSSEGLQVLCMGYRSASKYQVGLLMVHRTHTKGFKYWRRIALLSWSTFDTDTLGAWCEDYEFLHGRSGWKVTSDYFG
jgi:Heterokaryon incompatibility protein (HET)